MSGEEKPDSPGLVGCQFSWSWPIKGSPGVCGVCRKVFEKTSFKCLAVETFTAARREFQGGCEVIRLWTLCRELQLAINVLKVQRSHLENKDVLVKLGFILHNSKIIKSSLVSIYFVFPFALQKYLMKSWELRLLSLCSEVETKKFKINGIFFKTVQ